MKRQTLSPARSSLENMIDAARRTVDRYINSIFAFNHHAALVRSMVIGVAFIVIWLVLSFTARAPEEYSSLLSDWLNTVASGDPTELLKSSFGTFATIFFNPVVIRHLLALYVPFWLMEHVASIYLADIFEKEEEVAHIFIRQAAFADSYNTIHIRQGQVIKSDQESPMIQIGGPGYVVVELDSAVVFERPDGTPHVIGSTSKEWHGSAIVEGFERIRQGVDLRDVIQKQEITTRSRDGIPVTAKDIQYSYSLYRGPKPIKSPQTPYPFDEKAVLNLVYGSATRPVKLGEPPSQIQDWLEPLPGKIFGQISSEMSNFINKRSLSDFLVTVGKPEDDSLEERKKDTDERIRAISGLTENNVDQAAIQSVISFLDPDPPEPEAPPVNPDETMRVETASPALEFVPRSLLTKMFYDNFQLKAPQRGTYLNWIGVGTWDTPAQIIPRNHREAWKISRENFARGNSTELQRIYDDAKLHEFLRLIDEVPIRKLYIDLQNQEIDKQVKGVLKEYLGVLERARELYRRDSIPVDILKAIREIERWLYSDEYYSVGEED
jgi:hypothetical protein